MTKYETDFTTGAYDLPTPSEVAAAERAYARETRRLGASIAAWEGENAESEWMYLDADMCERHADIVEDPSRADSYEAYMHIVEEYQAMLDDGAPASGIILYLPHKYIEQLNERRREMSAEKTLSQQKLEDIYKYANDEGNKIEMDMSSINSAKDALNKNSIGQRLVAEYRPADFDDNQQWTEEQLQNREIMLENLEKLFSSIEQRDIDSIEIEDEHEAV